MAGLNKRVNVTLQFMLSDETGIIAKNTHELMDLPFAEAIFVEGKMLEVLTALHELGKQWAAGEPSQFSQ